MKILALIILLATATLSRDALHVSDSITLVASTPADGEVRKMLGLDTSEQIDFIRWSVQLNPENKFAISIRYGVGQQGTPGFVNGGKTLTKSGAYTVVPQTFGHGSKDVYKLRADQGTVVTLVKLNANTFHILDSPNALMRGNAGWSYTLTRKDPIQNGDTKITSLSDEEILMTEKSALVTFVGRTPCAALVTEHSWAKCSNSPKLKWRIVLKRDPATGSPAGYTMRRVDSQANDTEGKWEVVQSNNAVYYKLETTVPNDPLMLLVADRNVLYFVDTQLRIYPGNEDFSYAINREEK